MSLLVILMCFARMAECTEFNAPLVIRKELTTAECEREIDRIVGEAKAGVYANPRGGHYALACKAMEPKA
jgi:hypothetical protein